MAVRRMIKPLAHGPRNPDRADKEDHICCALSPHAKEKKYAGN